MRRNFILGNLNIFGEVKEKEERKSKRRKREKCEKEIE